MDSARRADQASMPTQYTATAVPAGAPYALHTLLRHPLALPVLAAGTAGVIAATTILFLPDWRLERLAWDLYLDKITDAARPPLGMTARAIMALAAGVSAATLTGLLAYITTRFSKAKFGADLGGKTMGLSRPNWKFWDRAARQNAAVDAVPHVRRRDFHPDAPAPRPVQAHQELGAPLPPVAGNSGPLVAGNSGPLVGEFPLAQKSAARVAAVMPDAAPVDWAAPDDVLDLGTAITLTEEEYRSAPVETVANPAVTTAASATPGAKSATGIEFPKWAYEEGLRMAAEDPDYAANAVELARRIHPPTPPEDMPVLPPHSTTVAASAPLPAQPNGMPTIATPENAAAWDMNAKLSDFGATAPGVAASPAQIEQILTAMHSDMVVQSAQQPAAGPAADFAAVPTAAPASAPVDAEIVDIDASLDAMVDRLERALAQRNVAGSATLAYEHVAVSAQAATIQSPNGTVADPALDAALSTLARMNRQAYG